jgi:transposase-like protein
MEKKENLRKKYSDDFRQKVVREFIESKQTMSVFSQKMGIDNSMLSRWIKKYWNECGTVPVVISGEKNCVEEVIALKKELASIRETVTVLQKILERTFAEKYAVASEVNSKKKVNK